MNPGATIVDGALWLAIPVALLAGLISFVSPCVLPLVPGYLGFIGGTVAPRAPRGVAGSENPDAHAESRGRAGAGTDTMTRTSTTTRAPAGVGRGRLLGGVLLFIAGFTLVFMTVTILGGAAGRFFLQYGDLITRVMGVVIIVMGLVFIGLFGVAQRTVRPQLGGNAGLIGAPLLGLAMGIGWTPCIGPTLTAIVSVSWNLGDPWRAAWLGLAYSAGLGIPFVLIALGLGWATRSVEFLRRHIRVVNIVGGVMLVALGVLMLTGLWGQIMSRLGAVIGSVQLPL